MGSSLLPAHRAVTTGTSSAAPSSQAFSTSQSVLPPFRVVHAAPWVRQAHGMAWLGIALWAMMLCPWYVVQQLQEGWYRALKEAVQQGK